MNTDAKNTSYNQTIDFDNEENFENESINDLPVFKCSSCGAGVDDHGNPGQAGNKWLGLGQMGPCQSCGADYENQDHARKKPIDSWNVVDLQAEVQAVEKAYRNLDLYMTSEQIKRNRNYYATLVVALLLPQNLYHLGNRSEAMTLYRQRKHIWDEFERLRNSDLSYEEISNAFFENLNAGEEKQLSAIAKLERKARNLALHKNKSF